MVPRGRQLVVHGTRTICQTPTICQRASAKRFSSTHINNCESSNSVLGYCETACRYARPEGGHARLRPTLAASIKKARLPWV